MNNNPLHGLAGRITEKFITAAPKAASEALSALATHEVLLLIGGLKAQTLVAVLNEMDAPKAAAVLRRLPFKQATYVLTHLDVTQASKLWKEFAAPYQERLKEVLAPAFVELLTQAGGFPADSAGRSMQTDFVAVRTETKVAELVGRLKNLPRPKLPAVCFVTGKNGELKGTIRTIEMVFLNPQAVCGSVMNKDIRALKPHDALTIAQTVFKQADADLLPVTNDEGILIGVLAKSVVISATPQKTWWDKLKI